MSSNPGINNRFSKLSININNKSVVFTITDEDEELIYSDIIISGTHEQKKFKSIRNESEVSYTLTWKEVSQFVQSKDSSPFSFSMSNFPSKDSSAILSTDSFKSIQINSMDPVKFEKNTFTVAIDPFSNNINLHVNFIPSREKAVLSNEITEFIVENNSFKVEGLLTLHTFHCKKMELLIKNNSETVTLIQPVDFTHYNQENTQTTYSYSSSINLDYLNKQVRILSEGDEVFTIQMRIELNESINPLVDSLTFPNPLSYSKPLPQKIMYYGKQGYLFSLGFSSQGLIEMHALFYEKETLIYKKEREQTIHLTRPFNQQKSIWLFGGETPYQITKNTWAIFLEVLEKYPDKEIYYILDSSSEDWEWANSLIPDRILSYKSKQYIWNLLLAEKIVTSGPTFYHLPSRSPVEMNLIRAEKIMIPEGIIGLSNEQWRLNQNNNFLKLNKIVVGTTVEKRFLLESLNFKPDQIIVNGLPNQEELVNSKPIESSRLVLFPKSMQYRFQSPLEKTENPWKSLATNSSFIDFCSANRLNPTIILSNQDNSLDKDEIFFNEKSIETILLEECDLSEILQSTRILVTDYQSEALNFTLLKRPIFFLQIESYSINSIHTKEYKIPGLQNDLPGEIVTNETDLLFLMHQSQKNDFALSRSQTKKAAHLTPASLQNTSSLILDALF
ncbi:CDP-glycerol glycerophosphotransferase family protein [Lacticigenium naphthae]|uniref:CDP-glycerol glycerophosphotransferase family protein n=1 Tax=Lacticigenium naphthae TaxID=515351 RepID=UPI0003F9D97D|nr:CDP-glycerol glycerophosphotransferase family protein [Lacticigenium naphthae]